MDDVKNALISLAKHVPLRVVQTLRYPSVQNEVIEALGDSMPYYYNTQLFKMPPGVLGPFPPISDRPFDVPPKSGCACKGMGDAQEDTLTKALPFIATGIAAIVGYNIWRSLQ